MAAKKKVCALIRKEAKAAGKKPSKSVLKAAGCRVSAPKKKKAASKKSRTLIAVKPGEIITLRSWMKSQGFKGLAGRRMRRRAVR